MRFSKLILRNLFRNRIRAVLTMLLLATIFFFVAVLMGVLHSYTAVSESGLTRLVVENGIALTNRLPLAYQQTLQRLPGVVAVCKQQWIGNYYKDKKDYFPNFAVDHETFGTVFDDYKVDPQQLAAWRADRQGALFGPELMQRFGWKVGQRITLIHNIAPYDAELTIRGIVHHPSAVSSLFFHWNYNQLSAPSTSRVGTYWIRVKDRSLMAPLAQQIDAMYHNCEYPTETFSENEYQASQVALIGKVSLLFTCLSACAIVMVIAFAAITMTMSARERVTEIAVLKTIGFGKGRVVALMLAEFMLLSVAAGLFGTIAAKVIFTFTDMTKFTSGAVKGFAIDGSIIATCGAIAAGVGVIAGGLPAIRAANLSVAYGLRRVV